MSKSDIPKPKTHRLSVRFKHYYDSPWREYLILGSPDGHWSLVGEGDYYDRVSTWAEVVEWIVNNYAWEELSILKVDQPASIEELTQIVREV